MSSPSSTAKSTRRSTQAMKIRNSRSRAVVLHALTSLAVVGVCLAVSACSQSQAESSSVQHVSIDDQPIAKYQRELLDVAFKAASAFPLQPHIKNRSRAQCEVIDAEFELDQPRRALACIDGLADWNRGKCYADFAFYCARHGDAKDVAHYLELASQIAEARKSDADSQDWQIDRINVAIAKTHAWMGNLDAAARLQAGTVAFESGKVEAVKAMLIEPKDFDAEYGELDTTIGRGNFDQTQSALEVCAQLFNRFYDDVERRTRVADRIRSGGTKLPIQVRIDMLQELAKFALEHKDSKTALAMLDEEQNLIDTNNWLPENRVPVVARLSALRFQAGDTKIARRDVDAALAMFDQERANIVDIWRGGALRPLAECYQSMGDTKKALELYKRAVEEGVANKNSRPRCDDLVATCCSMALNKVEPDAELRARILQIQAALGEPW